MKVTLNDPPSIALKDVLAGGAASRVSRWRPGTRAAYCNSGAAILAAVIEKASEERFEDYVRGHIFKPLHMDSAGYFLTPEVERGLTKLYHPDAITPYAYWHMRYWPSGAINASANDMANFVRFYLQRGSLDGTQLLRPESIERMETTESLPSAKLGKLGGYGLFNYATFEGAFVFRGHIGTVMGGVADVAYLPEHGRGYAVMLNAGSEGTLFRIETLIRQYLIRDLTPPVLPPAASVPAQVQQHYAGYYQLISPRIQMLYGLERMLNIKKLTFTAQGLSTSIYRQDPEQWVPVTERLFRQGDQSLATLALLPDADGQTLIETVRIFNDWGTFKRVSALRGCGDRSLPSA